jgi:hypothetical protein
MNGFHAGRPASRLAFLVIAGILACGVSGTTWGARGDPRVCVVVVSRTQSLLTSTPVGRCYLQDCGSYTAGYSGTAGKKTANISITYRPLREHKACGNARGRDEEPLWVYSWQCDGDKTLCPTFYSAKESCAAHTRAELEQVSQALAKQVFCQSNKNTGPQ